MKKCPSLPGHVFTQLETYNSYDLSTNYNHCVELMKCNYLSNLSGLVDLFSIVQIIEHWQSRDPGSIVGRDPFSPSCKISTPSLAAYYYLFFFKMRITFMYFAISLLTLLKNPFCFSSNDSSTLLHEILQYITTVKKNL